MLFATQPKLGVSTISYKQGEMVSWKQREQIHTGSYIVDRKGSMAIKFQIKVNHLGFLAVSWQTSLNY